MAEHLDFVANATMTVRLPSGVPQNRMFHVMRNTADGGTPEVELLAGAESALRVALPPDWVLTAKWQPQMQGSRARPDALLTIKAPDGTSSVVLVEAKRWIEPRDVSRVAAQIERLAGERVDAAIVATSFASPMTRNLLAESSLGWFDPTGNLRLRVNRPSVFIDRVGASRISSADPADRRLKSLRGAAAAKVVLGLCEADLPVRVRALASLTGVSVASSARVLDLLDREGAISRGSQGEVTTVRKQTMVRRWTEDYGLTRSNETVAAVDPRGLDHALDSLRAVDQRCTITGSAATRPYLPSGVIPVAPLMTLTLYADNPVVLIREVGMRKAERGANVLVARPFDEVVHSSSRVFEGVRYAAPAQVVADLLTGPGRATEEAEQLLDVLAVTDSGWAS